MIFDSPLNSYAADVGLHISNSAWVAPPKFAAIHSHMRKKTCTHKPRSAGGPCDLYKRRQINLHMP